jgi:IPT/TIG domain
MPVVSQPPPVLRGYPGQGLTINGKNFDTTGLTQIFFGGVAVNATCPTREQCSCIVPPNTTGSELVTISVNGRSANVGTFTYLPPGPSCAYSVVTGDVDFINTDCVDDSLGDAITIYYYEQYHGDGPAWVPVYDYTGSQELEPLGTAEAGLSYTFAGCYTVNGVPALPGSLGCDTGTTVTIRDPYPIFHIDRIQ